MRPLCSIIQTWTAQTLPSNQRAADHGGGVMMRKQVQMLFCKHWLLLPAGWWPGGQADGTAGRENTQIISANNHTIPTQGDHW